MARIQFHSRPLNLPRYQPSPLARLDYPLKHPARSPEYLYIMRPPVDDDSQDEQAEEENKIINEVNTLSFVLNSHKVEC